MQEQILEEIPIKNDYDAVRVRQAVRRRALEMGFSMIAQTKISTVASELARNILNYAEEGSIRISKVTDANRQGLKLVFQDNGPGIRDVAQAMRNGYSSTMSLGMGLAISKKFSNVFDIQTTEGKGTTVTVTNWVKSHENRRPPRIFNPAKFSGSPAK